MVFRVKRLQGNKHREHLDEEDRLGRNYFPLKINQSVTSEFVIIKKAKLTGGGLFWTVGVYTGAAGL